VPVNIHAPYHVRTREALADSSLRIALDRATARMGIQRATSLAAVDAPRLRDQVRQMKEYVLRNLPDLLEQFEQNLIQNGGQVHWARDAAEANRLILEIARQNQVRSVVKSKSMATEEIHLNDALETAGIGVVETDLGEYIAQMAGEIPSHIVAPIIHKRVEDISALFQRELAMPATVDPGIICNTARRRLRQDFLQADMGISGCNMGIADSGTVCIVTNEGNGRMVTSMPRVYVAVMGIEKLVPSVEDAFLQLQALTRSATGQQLSVYFSMTSGPRREEDPDGPEQFHVILIDNGRTRILEQGYGEALLCIRCGACLNVCPVYREIGGHAYGSTYSGPIGAVITPLLAGDIKSAKELPHASTLCGACRDACPVRIDLPRLLVDLRADLVEEGAAPLVERGGMKAFVTMMGGRRRYEGASRSGALATWLVQALEGGSITMLPPPLNGWTRSRDFPILATKSFRQQWAERMASNKQEVNR
jgi:L-lactate dehydrogenase complex protein LldF